MPVLRVFAPRDIRQAERRAAVTPETVKKMRDLGLTVAVESGVGAGALFSDAAYREAGASVVDASKDAYAGADVLLAVNPPTQHPSLGAHQATLIRAGAVWISTMIPSAELDAVRLLRDRRVTTFSLNLLPRIARAQKMDVLSSQSNIAGYKAVLLAAAALPKMFPLMMTAAGTLQPARVFILGAGVAGLQAIATAKRLGARVEATDVRPAVKEQVESLGATFVEMPSRPDSEDKGGYAKEVSQDYLKKQAEVMGDRLAQADVVITTALVPGKKAPVLIPRDMVSRMRPGSIIVDLAAEQGGNCELTRAGETVSVNGVTILGPADIVSSVAVHASEVYAKNVLGFLAGLVKDGALALNFEDEIYRDTVVCHDGKVMNAALAALL